MQQVQIQNGSNASKLFIASQTLPRFRYYVRFQRDHDIHSIDFWCQLCIYHDAPGVGKEILVNVPMELEPQLSTTLAGLAEKKAWNSWVETEANHLQDLKANYDKYSAQKVVTLQ